MKSINFFMKQNRYRKFLALPLLFLTLGVNHAWGASATWTKVTSEPADWSGEYIVVYNGQAYDGSLTSGFDAQDNYQTATDNGSGTITLDDSYSITIAKVATGYYSVQTAAGYYIGRKANSNGMDASTTYDAANHKNTITWNSTNKYVKIAGPGGRCLGNNSGRWRFFSSGNAYVQVFLYKKSACSNKVTLTKGSPSNGSFTLTHFFLTLEAYWTNLGLISEAYRIIPPLIYTKYISRGFKLSTFI